MLWKTQAAGATVGRSEPIALHFFVGSIILSACALVLGACGAKNPDDTATIQVRGGKIYANIASSKDSVFEAASRVLVQERINLRVYLPQEGILETGFFDLARFPNRFDREIWDDNQRLIKLRCRAEQREEHTVLVCEPLYNPHEIVTQETDYTLLRPVPPGHPGFDVAVRLTHRIAAQAEGRTVTPP